MAGLQETVSRATRHLGDMTLSQRLAVGMGVLLVAGSLFWLAQWAAKPDMAPLLNQALDADELEVLRTGLDAMGEPYTVEGSQLMVRSSANRPAIIAALQQAEKMPSDTAASFADLVKEANPWISGQENDRRWTVALQSELARVLRKFNGVKQASVILNLNARPRGFSRRESEATASVTLFSQGGEPISRSLALAAARMVAGAVRGLPVKNVEVIDGSTSRTALDWEGVEDGGASNIQRQRRQLERERALQIREQLSFDPHALVSVSAELEYSSVQENNLTISEGVRVEKEEDKTNTTRDVSAGQPGAQPNTGMAVGGGGGGDTSMSNRKHEVVEPSRLTSVKQTPAGVPKTISAAVSLSRSYLSNIYERNNPDTETPPTDEQIVEVFNKQKDAIVTLLSKLTMPQEAEQVSLAWHHDAETEAVEASGALDTSLELAGRYGPASGLGLLALVALGMMFKMSKQKGDGESFGMEIGLPEDAIDAAKRAAESLRTSSRRGARGGSGGGAGAMAGESTYGPVSSAANEPEPMAPIPVGQGAEGVLEAREVDETAVQISHMVDQVASMTEEDGDAVANLIENWIDNNG